MVGRVSHVQAVRQRGGDCVEVARGRVRVEREGRDVDRQAEENDHEWEEERLREMEDKRAVAEVRGREAEVKLAKEHWIQDRIKKAELERRESVRLMEMLRTAKMMSNPKRAHHIDADVVRDEDHDDEKVGSDKENVKDYRERRTLVSTSRNAQTAVQNKSAAVTGLCGERSHSGDVHEERRREDDLVDGADAVADIRREKTRLIESEKEKKALEMRRRAEQKQLLKLVSPLGELDSTEEVSCLSTIDEETETISPSHMDSVDEARGRERLEDSKESSVSPFPVSNIERRKIVETDLTAVKQLMARVKMQGKVLEKADTHFMTVEGRPGGEEGNHSAAAKPYKIDQQFVKRVLEFSSSSTASSFAFSSSTTSQDKESSNSFKATNFKAPSLPLPTAVKNPKSTHHQHKVLKPPSKRSNRPPKDEEPLPQACLPPPVSTHPKQQHLRYYIEKLLSLRQEEVQNLSVSSCSTPPEIKMKKHSKGKTATTASLSLSTTSCSLKQSMAEDSQAIQSMYHSTRQQLLTKLSSVTSGQVRGQQLEWSSFDLSSGGEVVGDSSSGTITSLQLSTTEYESW